MSVNPQLPLTCRPIRIASYQIDGFIVGVEPGQVSIQPRGGFISDQPEFHRFIDSVTSTLTKSLEDSGHVVMFDTISRMLLVVHDDRSGELYLDEIPVVLLAQVKRSYQIGDLMSDKTMADISRLNFDGIDLKPTDQVIFCFKVGWKFALFFDLGRKRFDDHPGFPLDVDAMEKDLGHLYRILRFQGAYEAMADDELFVRLLDAGWFPFIEILGAEFQALKTGFVEGGTEVQEQRLIAAFNDERLDGMVDGWWNHPTLSKRRAILQPAIDAFKRNEPVVTIKIILTEIEGVICDAYVDQQGEKAKLGMLLEFLVERGISKSSKSSTYFPMEFLRYLKECTFGNYDPISGSGQAKTRHGVSHGAAAADDYDMQRALQCILTMDQLRFYL